MNNLVRKYAALVLLLPGMALAGPMAQPQCAQVICLSPADGTPAPSECRAIRQVYFNLRVLNPIYNPSATADLRHNFLSMCLTARAVDLYKIKMKYGPLYDDPLVF